MHLDDDSKRYTVPPEIRGYFELSIAIIGRAVEDYRASRKRYLRGNKKSAYSEMECVRDFFLSDIFGAISLIENPYDFINALDRQIDDELSSGKCRKRKYVRTK